MSVSRQAPVTQEDVARRAGVHRATVSRALDPERRALLDAETVERVLAAVDELGYRPNRLAQGLRRQRSSLVGLVVPDLATQVAAAVVAAFEPAARAHGLTPLVLASGDDPAALATVAATLESMRADAAVLATERAPGAALAGLAGYSGPVVLLGGGAEGAEAALAIDDSAAIEIAVLHLVRLGHRRIALIGAPRSSSRGAAHVAGWQRALAGAGLAADRALAYAAEPSRVLAAREACAALLGPADPPTAIVVADDETALGCIAALRERGLEVPRDVSVVGVGNASFGRYLAPALTTVSLPLAALGRQAAELAAALATGGPAPPARPGALRPHLVQRGTTAAPPTGVGTP